MGVAHCDFDTTGAALPSRRKTRNSLGDAQVSGSFADTHGYAEVSAGGGARQSALANETDLGTAFAVATSLMGNNNVLVSGNLGYGSTTGTPAAAFRTTYSRQVGSTAPEVSVTVRQLQVPVMAGQALFGPQDQTRRGCRRSAWDSTTR